MQSQTKRITWVFLFPLLFGVSAGAAIPPPTPATALIYEADTGRKTPIYRYTRTEKLNPGAVLEIDAVFASMDGSPAYVEKALSKDGKVLEYSWTHHQLGQTGSVKVEGGKVHYSVTEHGQTQTGETPAPENLVLGPTMITYLQKNWDRLASQNGVDVRIGVPDRMSDYGFRFTLVPEEKAAAKEISEVILKPTSFFVSMVVSPIVFIFAKDGSRLIAMKGKTLLKVKRGKSWVDLVAETVFE